MRCEDRLLVFWLVCLPADVQRVTDKTLLHIRVCMYVAIVNDLCDELQRCQIDERTLQNWKTRANDPLPFGLAPMEVERNEEEEPVAMRGLAETRARVAGLPADRPSFVVLPQLVPAWFWAHTHVNKLPSGWSSTCLRQEFSCLATSAELSARALRASGSCASGGWGWGRGECIVAAETEGGWVSGAVERGA